MSTTIWYLQFHEGHEAWVIGTTRTVSGRRMAWQDLIPGSALNPPSGVDLMPYLAMAEAAMDRAATRFAQEAT